jgi:hypothetical protein
MTLILLAIESVFALRLLCGAGGIFVAIAAMVNISAFAAGISGRRLK